MPQISRQQRAQGGHRPTQVQPDPNRDWSQPCSAAELQARVLPYPDQSRYGSATTDPLGREGPGWHKGPSGLPTRDKQPKGDTRR